MSRQAEGPAGHGAVADGTPHDVLHDFFEFAPIGCALVKDDGAILHANGTLAAMLGLSRPELMGTSLLAHIDQADRLATQQVLARASEANGDAPIDVRLPGRGVDLRVCLLSACRSASLGAIRVALTDKSGRRAIERMETFAHKMDAIGRMAGDIAHDLNNVLTVMRMHDDHVLSTLAPDDERREDLLAIRNALRRAASLTSRLLAFARPQVLDSRRVDANALVVDFLRAHQPRLAPGVELTLRTAQPPAEIEIDPALMEQVLAHLVRNAEEAMPDGGELTVETASVELGAEALAGHPGVAPGWFTRIRVRDTGLGMAPSTLTQAFEPYFTTKARRNGLGLGLPTVYAIARQRGGFVTVSSEPDAGTTCDVFFPEVQGTEPVSVSSPSAATASGTETLLIAEDEPAIRMAIQRVLERQGYVCHTAVDGDDALRKIESLDGRIDLLLSDVVMPNRNGPELVQRMRERYPSIPVVFMTGFASAEEAAGSEVPAHSGVLHKPFALQALRKMVREAIDAAQRGAVVK